jgi:NAD-dependent dihydropyrimidine dehydrogenase PreA subunit
MKREIVQIDDEKCNGCGNCIPNCHEGALQIIDGKAVLVSELMCDGLGACLGHCPEGALTIEEREAEAYNEVQVIKAMINKGKNVITAHLKHLKEHGETIFLKQGLEYLVQHQPELSFDLMEVVDDVHHTLPNEQAKSKPQVATTVTHHHGGGCPGSQARSFAPVNQATTNKDNTPSALTQWPVQMHLINPAASYFQGADLLIAADCVAFSLGNFHSKFLQGKKLAIACPKLDSNKEVYQQKITSLIDNVRVNTITVMIMEVPCCGGLLQLAINASNQANRKVPVKAITIGIQGDILAEDWV